MPIPKIIHQLWISPDHCQDIPDDIKENLRSWEETHPEYIRMMWSLPALSPLLEDFYGLNLLESIEVCRFPSMQSDIIRLALLYEYGGFWVDLKSYAMRPFINDLILHDTIVLVEHWPAKKQSKYHPRLLNGFLGAPRKNKYIWMWLNNAQENIKKRKKRGVAGLTGAGVMMRLMATLRDFHVGCDYHLIRQSDIWNVLIRQSGGSYNDSNQHWSLRQKRESPFIDNNMDSAIPALILDKQR